MSGILEQYRGNRRILYGTDALSAVFIIEKKKLGGKMEIRKLNPEQLEEIKDFFRDIFMNEPWNDDWSNDEQLTSYILDLSANRNSLPLGLYVNGELTGLSLGSIVHWCTGTEYYIYEFCIRRDLQGRGYGKRFLSEIEKQVKELGVNHIFLQTERTVPAYKFYTNNGFTELKEHASLVKMLDE